MGSWPIHHENDSLLFINNDSRKDGGTMASIGDNIKLYRERVNMSQQDLALRIRVGASKIANYETGKQVPTKETIMKISTVLDVPAAELMKIKVQGQEQFLQ